jgi:hypothetical protein
MVHGTGNDMQGAQFPNWLEWTLPPDVVVADVLVSAPLVVALLAVVVALPMLYLADRISLARWVWHPPLFSLGFFCLIYVLLGLWLLPR